MQFHADGMGGGLTRSAQSPAGGSRRGSLFVGQAQRERDAMGFPKWSRGGRRQGGRDFFAQGLDRGGNWVHRERLTRFPTRNNPAYASAVGFSRSGRWIGIAGEILKDEPD